MRRVLGPNVNFYNNFYYERNGRELTANIWGRAL